MPNLLNARDFADRAAHIVQSLTGNPAHRAMDALVMNQLRSLGYGEGVDLFEAAVSDKHIGPGPVEDSNR